LVSRFTPAPRHRNLSHQSMKADGVGCDRRLRLIHDCLAVDKPKSAQRRHDLVEAVTGECRGKRLFEFVKRLGEQEQRD
jgi:hypothetical protein